MSDFSELEKELRKLRPAQPSPVLFERVGEALKDSRAGTKERRSLVHRLGGLETAHPWWSLGFGLAAAAILILFAVVALERRHEQQQAVATKFAVRPKDDRFRWGRNDPRHPASSFLPVGRMSFITRGTKDYILLTDQNDRCDAFATAHNKPGGGAIWKRVHRFACPIPARKSC